MALTVTDRGTFQTAAGGTITMTATSSAFSVAAGTILVVGIFENVQNNESGSSNDSFAASDNIADTGGGSWTKRASCTRGSVVHGSYCERVELWSRVIGTSPGTSKTVTTTATTGVINTSPDGWFGAHLWEVAGQHASPIGLSASPSPATSAATFNTDLGGTPAASSAVFGVIHDDNQVGPAVTQPSGWTESDEQSPAWGAISEWAFINGSSIQSPQWSGFTNSASVRILGCAVEIIAAAGAATKAGAFPGHRIQPILMRK